MMDKELLQDYIVERWLTKREAPMLIKITNKDYKKIRKLAAAHFAVESLDMDEEIGSVHEWQIALATVHFIISDVTQEGIFS